MTRVAVAALSAMILVASAFACGKLEGASTDSTGDDAGADAAVFEDAAADASADAPADASTPCVPDLPKHYCDDFDDTSTSFDFGWTDLPTDGGTLGPTDRAFSPPRALLTGLAAEPGNAYHESMLLRSLPTGFVPTQKATLTFRIRVEKAPNAVASGAYMHFAVLVLDDPTCADLVDGVRLRDVEVGISHGGRVMLELKGLMQECPSDGGAVNDYDDTESSALLGADGAFHELQLRLSKTDACPGLSGPSVSLALDGQTLTCRPVLNPFDHANRLDLGLGLAGGGPFDATSAVFDDVVLDLE